MAPLDLVLLVFFGILAAGGLLGAFLCLRRAMRVSPDAEFTMFLWAAGVLVGLIVAGVSAAYIILPILLAS